MKFSICIPNFNYEDYLKLTIPSVLAQKADFEIVVADNASTDGSVKVLEGFKDDRIKVKVNAANVGFAGNLDKAGAMASGEVMIMLSSDDLVKPGALEQYDAFFKAIEPGAVVSSTAEVIDSKGVTIGALEPDPELWRTEDLVTGLPVPEGTRVFRVSGEELLKRCLKTLRNPFNFLATAYPRALYTKVEGYGGNRLINPDKWFHWKLLGVATHAYFIDRPLFAYRWHARNQTAQQAASGALKYLVDEYVNTFEVDKTMLARAGVSRDELERAFVEHDVARHGLAALAQDQSEKARRVLFFGASAYPKHAARNWKWWALGGLLASGPLGRLAAKASYKMLKSRGTMAGRSGP